MSSPTTTSRRSFLKNSAAAASLLALAGGERALAFQGLHLATNEYPWMVFYQRDKQDFNANLDKVLGEIAECRIQGYEPGLESLEELETLAPLLTKHRLEMRSIYVNSVLHEKQQIQTSLDQILSIARRARDLGTRIVVTNPNPIRWGGPENKSDEQLRIQADGLNQLGNRLSELGLTLAYHNHDPELRAAAREFHHMLVATDPGTVKFCLDAHWVYRGSENSSVALFDVVKLYGKRICEVHIRQSVGGIWTEDLCDGDIDYRHLVEMLAEMQVQPHLVLEQAVEAGSPHTMTAAEAHKKTAAYAWNVFLPLAE